MRRSSLRNRSAALLTVAALGATGCGGSDSGSPYEVVVDEVSHETTQEMAIFTPDAEGDWPVVFVYHGAGDTWENVAELSERVAREGRVVVAVTYRSNDRTGGIPSEIESDAECAYRYGRSIVSGYGGDLDLPVTMVGHSLGATVAVEQGLGADLYGPDGSYDTCFGGEPRPDVIVGIGGCYRWNGFNALRYQNADARVELITMSDDEYCPVEQSEFALESFTTLGYDVELHLMDDANHFSPIFHDKVDGEWIPLPDAPAGLETVQIIVEAGEGEG